MASAYIKLGVCGTVVCFLCYFYSSLLFVYPVVEHVPVRTVHNSEIKNDNSGFKMRHLNWYKDDNEWNTTWPTTVVMGDDDDNSSDTGDDDCSDVHKVNSTSKCYFVQHTDDCDIDEGFIDYTDFAYCELRSSLLPLALIILFIWWLLLFIGLAVTADDFFCPALAVISKTMRLSHNIAGVTFLAFGNGAPDIFSAIAAIGNANNGEAGLAFGALLGAGVFVTAVVAGTIAIICPFDAMQRPFLRDIIFYLAAVFWTFSIMWNGEITRLEAIGFILLYLGYVAVVVLGRYIYQKSKPPTVIAEINVVGDEYSEANSADPSEREREPLLGVVNRTGSKSSNDSIDKTPFQEFLSALNPIDTENWADMGILKKIYEVFKSPVLFLLMITTPVVDYDNDDKHNWNRHLNSLQCTTGLVFASIATKVGFHSMGSFPVWALALLIGIALSVLVFFTSKSDVQPRYHAVFAYLGFVVSVVWIYSIANEVVNILQTFGVVFSISNAVLGLTLLAWGNSIGDFIADTVMARQGYPRMGISACFGGPLFNLLLGIGIPFTIQTVKTGTSYKLSITLEEYVLAGFLALSLVFSLVVVPLFKFRMSRPYGIALIVLYIVFLVVALLTEAGVITADLKNGS